MLSLKAMSVTWSVGRSAVEERLHGGLQRRHRVGHAVADVDGHDQLERDVLADERGQPLRHVVFLHAERSRGRPCTNLSWPSVTVAVTWTTSTSTDSV